MEQDVYKPRLKRSGIAAIDNFIFNDKFPNRRRNKVFIEPYWVSVFLGFGPLIFISLITLSLHALSLETTAIIFALLATGFSFYGLISLCLSYVKEQRSKKMLNPDHEYEAELTPSFSPDRYQSEVERERVKDKYFDRMAYLFHGFFFLTFFLLVYTAFVTQSFMLAMVFAIMWGFAIAPVAESWSHEFVHRRSKFQQMLGASVWASFFYGTFLPEHTMGHHVHVSTPEDASSARKGQTIYEFIPNAVRKNIAAGFRLEAKRLGNRNLGFWSVRNRVIWLTLFSFLVLGLSYLIGGAYGLVFFAAQTVFSIITIEVANYIMHYGLQRRKLPNGRYERVSPLHSWNREGPTHLLVANLTRHSDHHAFPRRPYQILRFFEEAPQLPLPYEILLFLVWSPKNFFLAMDHHVDKHMEKLRYWQENNVDDYERVMGFAEFKSK